MNLDKETGCGCESKDSKENKSCGCSGHDQNESCDCSGHDQDESCGCSGHDQDESCGCDTEEHEHHSVTLTLEDDTELNCPVIDAFEINEQQYMALLHPVDETVLLYRFFENEDDSIDLETIDSDEEFDLVSKTFLALQED